MKESSLQPAVAVARGNRSSCAPSRILETAVDRLQFLGAPPESWLPWLQVGPPSGRERYAPDCTTGGPSGGVARRSRGRSCVLLAPCQPTRQPHTRPRPTTVSRFKLRSARRNSTDSIRQRGYATRWRNRRPASTARSIPCCLCARYLNLKPRREPTGFRRTLAAIRQEPGNKNPAEAGFE